MSKKTKKAMIFVPLVKVDEAKREVTGIITAEVLDKAGETFHYESSAPYFKAWSAQFESVTKGKSKGNVRSMHAAKAVGKLTDIQFDDANKVITATAKIVDDAEWEKVQEGVYTGFSIGGNYVKQWEEEVNAVKVNFFTADPIEVSIVDNPCVPTAHFTAVKADGTEIQKAFKLPEVKEPTNEEIAAKAAEIATEKGGTWVNFVYEARELLKAESAGASEEDDEDEVEETEEETNEEEEEEEEAAEKVEALKLVTQKWVATDGKTFDKKADCVAYQETLEDPVKVALAKADAVIKGETEAPALPADNVLVIRGNYVKAIQATYDTPEAKAEAVEAAKADWVRVVGTEPPAIDRVEAFFAQKAEEALGEVVKGWNDPELQKGMGRIRQWAWAIDEILYAACWCDDYESDDAPIYDQIKAICLGLLTFMMEFVDHEIGEMIAGFDKVAEPKGALAKALGGITKAAIDKIESPEVQKLQEELELQKARGDKLEKQVSEAVTGISSLTEQIKELKSQPQPRRHPMGKTVDKGADMGQSVVSTGEDAGKTLEELVAKYGQAEVSKMLIKLSQSQPMTMK